MAENLNDTVKGTVIKGVEGVVQNISLVVGKFNSEANSEESKVEEIPTLGDAFRKYKPSVEIDFKVEGREPETIQFDRMDDFDVQNGEGGLVQKSKYLSERKTNIDAYTRLHDAIQSNPELRAILNDAESRGQLRDVLEQMLKELQNNH